LDAHYVKALLARGLAYGGKKDYERAMKDFEQVLALDAQNPEALCARGFIYANRGDYDLAIQDYDQALRLIPNLSQALAGRSADIRLRQQQGSRH
jgi:regulator of sirC expression with transglutaminase-like and TPR domain